jgi:ribonuclease P protein component
VSRYSLPSSERLKSSKSIAQLFSAGRSLAKHPVILRYHTVKDQAPGLKVAFTASKRAHKKAVDRNLLKRRMREAFRLNAEDLRSYIDEKGLCLEMIYIYSGKEILAFETIQKSIQHLLYHLGRKLKKDQA